MRQCMRCGREIDASARYCPECGAPNTIHPPPAGFWVRVLASFVDGLVFLPLVVLAFANIVQIKSLALLFATMVPGLLYKPLMESRFGATLGKMACKIKVIDDRGMAPTFTQAFTRYLPFFVSSIVALVGSVVMFSQPGFQEAVGLDKIGELQYENPVKLLQNVINIFILAECVVAGFTYRKQALHDMMAQTYCVRK